MSINYQPSNLLRRIAPKKLIERIVTQDLTVNKTAIAMLSRAGVLTQKKLTDLALRVIKQYKQAIKAGTVSKSEVLADKALMIQRIQNSVVFEITKDIKQEYRGEYYEWLPSDADEPDPEHQLKYGKKFQLGKGEAPGDRYGCRCGMNILVDETRLEL